MIEDHELVNKIGLLFLDAMSVKCEPGSYARRVISLVRMRPRFSDEQIDKAIMIACSVQPVGASDGDTYAIGVPTRESMRTAMEALTPPEEPIPRKKVGEEA